MTAFSYLIIIELFSPLCDVWRENLRSLEIGMREAKEDYS